MPITFQKSNQLKSIATLMMLCLHLFNQGYMRSAGKRPDKELDFLNTQSVNLWLIHIFFL